MDLGHPERLRRILHLLHLLHLLAARGVDISHATPACCSGAAFTPELRVAADRGQVPLVDLERLYRARSPSSAATQPVRDRDPRPGPGSVEGDGVVLRVNPS